MKLTAWSDEMIEETIGVFKPDAKRLGQEFTREDAIESLNNIVAFVECLIEMDRNLRKKEMPKLIEVIKQLQINKTSSV